MQVQNNKEEVPFAHYEEQFRAIDPEAAAKRCGVPFADGRFTVTLLGTNYEIRWPEYAISSDTEGAFALKNLPCQTFLLRFLLEGRAELLHPRAERECRPRQDPAGVRADVHFAPRHLAEGFELA